MGILIHFAMCLTLGVLIGKSFVNTKVPLWFQLIVVLISSLFLLRFNITIGLING